MWPPLLCVLCPAGEGSLLILRSCCSYADPGIRAVLSLNNLHYSALKRVYCIVADAWPLSGCPGSPRLSLGLTKSKSPQMLGHSS